MHWNAIISTVNTTSSLTDQALQRTVVQSCNPRIMFVFRVLLYQLATNLPLLKCIPCVVTPLDWTPIFDWHKHETPKDTFYNEN